MQHASMADFPANSEKIQWNERRRLAAARRLAASYSSSSLRPVSPKDNNATTLTAAWLRKHYKCASVPMWTEDTDEHEDTLRNVTHLSLTRSTDTPDITNLETLGELLPSLGKKNCMGSFPLDVTKRLFEMESSYFLRFFLFLNLPRSLQESFSLTHSCLSSLRDLGSRLGNLRVLDLTACNLQCLDGMAAFPLLEEVYLSHNVLRDLTPLFLHDHLTILDISHNLYLRLPSSMAPLHVLASCKNMHTLSMKETPVERALQNLAIGSKIDSSYRKIVGSLIPQVHVLDGKKLLKSEKDGEEQDIDEAAWRNVVLLLQKMEVEERDEEKTERWENRKADRVSKRITD